MPTPNHDHVIDISRVNATPIWWEVRPVLILDQSDWPAADGSSGITSSKAMDDAEAAARAIEVGSNFYFFLFPWPAAWAGKMCGTLDKPRLPRRELFSGGSRSYNRRIRPVVQVLRKLE